MMNQRIDLSRANALIDAYLAALAKHTPAPAAPAGIIPHSYVNASEQPGQYAADQCGRQAVTVEWLAKHAPDPDMAAWVYDAGDAELGLDPWRRIDGVDMATNGKTVNVWLAGRVRPMPDVSPSYVVYVQVKDLQHADIAIPAPGGLSKRRERKA